MSANAPAIPRRERLLIYGWGARSGATGGSCMSIAATARMIAQFSDLYWSQAETRTRDDFARAAADHWKEALAAFLAGYAFERAGRSPQYPKAAAQVIRVYAGDVPAADFEAVIWGEFLRAIDAPDTAKGANRLNNPLAPAEGRAISLTALVTSLARHEHNIVRWAEAAARAGEVEAVYQRLQEVRGVGPKIAAFFLRDVAEAFQIDELPAEQAAYLQPIDRWTRRGAEAFAQLLQRPEPQGHRACAEVIIAASRMAAVRPTLVNTGLWVFGAQVVRDEERFREVLAHPDEWRRFLLARSGEYRTRAEFLARVAGARTPTIPPGRAGDAAASSLRRVPRAPGRRRRS